MGRNRSYFAASYVKSAELHVGLLLFTLFRLLCMMQASGGNRLATTMGNVAALLWIGVPSMLLMVRKAGGCPISQGNFYIIINLMLAGWGAALCLADLAALILQFTIPRLMRLALTLAVVFLPPFLLWNADRNRVDPDSVLMTAIGAGGIGIAVLWLIMIVLQKAENGQLFFQIFPDLLFLFGCGLLSVSALKKGIRLRRGCNRTPEPQSVFGAGFFQPADSLRRKPAPGERVWG